MTPPHVTAVLVAHDGALWLPRALAALAAQTRPPDLVVGVDTGSTDSCAQLLVAALGNQALVSLPRDTGLGAAVNAGLAAREVSEHAHAQGWIWVLHDDCAPDPDALARLLEHAATSPGAAVLGPKLVDWSDPRRLLEVGLASDAAGHRDPGLEPGELDQGQHDRARDVLAVSTAGALIRRDAWERLGGFDPLLPLLQEDLDFGTRACLAGARVTCVPAARVRHVGALRSGLRSPGVLPGFRRAVDREHGLLVLLANATIVGLVFGLARVLLAQLGRVLGYLLTRRATEGGEELLALARLLGAPGRLVAARRWRARHRWNSGHRRGGRYRRGRLVLWDLRRLRVSRRHRLRVSVAGVAERWARPAEAPALSGGSDEDLPPDDGGLLRRWLTTPGVLVVLALALLALVAGRHLVGAGPLAGGRLLPAPGSDSRLWASWAASWHEAGIGSAAPAPPWTPILAAVGAVTGGSPALAVTLLLLLALPLAGATAYRAACRVLPDRRDGRVVLGLRVTAAVAYPLLCGLPAAVAAGRFDVVVAVVAVPALLTAGCQLLRADPGEVGWRRAWALGLGLTVALAFAPQLWLPVLALLAAGVAAVLLAASPANRGPALRRAAAAGIALAVPLVLLGPFTLHALAHPSVLLTGLGAAGGVAGAAGRPAGPLALLLLRPGSADPVPAWLAAPLVAGALVGLLRARRRFALAAIGLALIGWATALAESRTVVAPGYGWPGVGIAVAAAGLLAAALVAADGARGALGRQAFGWRQPLAGLLAVAGLLAPAVAAGVLIDRGFAGPVHRYGASPLPAFVLDDAQLDAGQRLLVLTGGRRGQVRYRLGAAGGPVLGDEDLPISPVTRGLLDALVGDLAAPLGSDAAAALATFHVRYVAVPPPVPAPLAVALDQQPGLTRMTAPAGTGLWRLTVPSSRVRLLAGAAAVTARAALPPVAPATGSGRRGEAGRSLPARPTTLPAGGPGRLLVLSEAFDPGWQARLAGRALPAVRAWGWAQAFEVPATTRALPLAVRHAGLALLVWHLVQGLLLVTVVVLAAPPVGRREDSAPRAPAAPPVAALVPA